MEAVAGRLDHVPAVRRRSLRGRWRRGARARPSSLSGCSSHSRVDPSRSVNKNVTVPDGSSTIVPPRCFRVARSTALRASSRRRAMRFRSVRELRPEAQRVPAEDAPRDRTPRAPRTRRGPTRPAPRRCGRGSAGSRSPRPGDRCRRSSASCSTNAAACSPAASSTCDVTLRCRPGWSGQREHRRQARERRTAAEIREAAVVEHDRHVRVARQHRRRARAARARATWRRCAGRGRLRCPRARRRRRRRTTSGGSDRCRTAARRGIRAPRRARAAALPDRDRRDRRSPRRPPGSGAACSASSTYELSLPYAPCACTSTARSTPASVAVVEVLLDGDRVLAEPLRPDARRAQRKARFVAARSRARGCR